MADFGRELISKTISDDDMRTAVEAGIRRTWFEDAEHRKVWDWMIEYLGRYGFTPTPRALHSEFPTYRLVKVPEPYDFYVDHFRHQRERAIAVDTVIDANAALDAGDPKKAHKIFADGLLKVGAEITSLLDYDVVDQLDHRITNYKKLSRNRGKLSGVPTGFPSLDFVTGGYQKGQFVIYIGVQKQGKSFLLLHSGIAAQSAGYKVLFVSFEMSWFEQAARYDGIVGGVNATDLMRGKSTEDDLRKIRRAVRRRREVQPLVIAEDISATTTVSALAGRIERHRPDIVFVDGVYLMDDDTNAQPQSTQAYTAISRGLKRLAQRTNVPLICTTQSLPGKVNKDRRLTLDSIGWTSAWGQDSDLIMGVERIEKTDLIKLRIVAGRNVSPQDFGIACDWDTCTFEETEDIDLNDYES